MSRNKGLPKLAGGIAKREREAWLKPCALGDGRPAAGLVDTLFRGPQPVCSQHIPEAEQRGYTVRRPEPQGALRGGPE